MRPCQPSRPKPSRQNANAAGFKFTWSRPSTTTTRRKKASRFCTPFRELSEQCSERTLLSRGRARCASIWGRGRAGAAATSRGGLLVAAGRERGQAAEDEQCANLLHQQILSESCWRNLFRMDVLTPFLPEEVVGCKSVRGRGTRFGIDGVTRIYCPGCPRPGIIRPCKPSHRRASQHKGVCHILLSSCTAVLALICDLGQCNCRWSIIGPGWWG